MKTFSFYVKGKNLEELQARIDDHVSRGARQIGEIQEGYYQSKSFQEADYRDLRQFRENYETANYTAKMEKDHVEKENRKTWKQGGF